MTKTSILLLFFLLIASHISAQKKSKASPVRIYYEQTPEGVLLLADNDAFCPFTLIIKLELVNMEADKGNLIEIVIPGQSARMELAEVKIIDRYEKSNFGFKTSYMQGNTLQKPEHIGVYRLPYQKGETYIMSQGYNGAFSHEGKNALDFTMPVGTEICAARNGIVTEIITENSKGCDDPKCLYYANSITIYHEDGTFAQYAHLSKNGSLVKPGDVIYTGQIIGYSGNTGYSSGPHLHFEVFYFDGTEQVSIPSQFEIDKEQIIYLQEKQAYTAR
jgi:murein DD-endopeptidase MepM/ murein hydrolase activator NlpD